MARCTPESISVVQKARQGEDLPTTPQTWPGYGANLHQGGRRQCPTFNQTYHLCQKIGHFAKVCCGRQAQQPTPKPKTTYLHLTPKSQLYPNLKPNRPFQEVAGDFCSHAGLSSTGGLLLWLAQYHPDVPRHHSSPPHQGGQTVILPHRCS